jgi:hypothetical protein
MIAPGEKEQESLHSVQYSTEAHNGSSVEFAGGGFSPENLTTRVRTCFNVGGAGKNSAKYQSQFERAGRLRAYSAYNDLSRCGANSLASPCLPSLHERQMLKCLAIEC